MTCSSPLAGLSPEFIAMSGLMSRFLDPEGPAPTVMESLSMIRDWPAFLQGMRRHRSIGMIAPCLADLPADTPYSAPVEQIRALWTQQRLQGLVLLTELQRLHNALSQHGIPYLNLKGLTLSQCVYGDPFTRGLGDIDILIAPATVKSTHTVLLTLGYTCLQPTVLDHLGSVLPWLKDITYQHTNGHLLEIHMKLWEGGLPFPEDFETLWDNRDHVIIQKTAYPVLSPDIRTLYLIGHGQRHCWDRLSWLADISQDLRSPERAAAVYRHCVAAGIPRYATHTFWLLNTCFGIQASVADFSPTVGRWFIRAFYGKRRWLTRPTRGDWAWIRNELLQRLWRLVLISEYRHLTAAFKTTLLNPVDFETLPRRLRRFYPVLRPLGWCLRNFKKRF